MEPTVVTDTPRPLAAKAAAKRLQEKMERLYGERQDGDDISYWYGKLEQLASLLEDSTIPTEDLWLVCNRWTTDADDLPYEVKATEELVINDCPEKWDYDIDLWHETVFDVLFSELRQNRVPFPYVKAIANVITEQFTPRERWWLGSQPKHAWWLLHTFYGLRDSFRRIIDITIATMHAVLEVAEKQAYYQRILEDGNAQPTHNG